MFSYIWPIALVVVSNVVYQICSKSIPGGVNPFAALTVTYFVGAVFCAAAFLMTTKGANLFRELAKANWASYLLGVVIVGLEAGFIYAYKAGWQVSTASVVQSAFLAIALLAVGALLYHEGLSRSKLVGVAICMIGLVFINKK